MMKGVLSVLLFVASFGPIQKVAINDTRYYTMFLRNCRYWETIPRELRTDFLDGYLEGIVTGLQKDTKENHEVTARLIPSRATTGEILRGLDVLCAQPENANLTLAMSLEIFTMKVKGMPQSEIDSTTTLFRQMSDAWRQP